MLQHRDNAWTKNCISCSAKSNTMQQSWFDVGPSSQTAAQHRTKIVPMHSAGRDSNKQPVKKQTGSRVSLMASSVSGSSTNSPHPPPRRGEHRKYRTSFFPWIFPQAYLFSLVVYFRDISRLLICLSERLMCFVCRWICRCFRRRKWVVQFYYCVSEISVR